MPDSSEAPWSDNPNAPKIPRWLHTVEKVHFAGFLIGATLYGTSTRTLTCVSSLCAPFTLGVVIALFFQCVGALLDPVNRTRGSIKWGLVAHTVAMFVFVTIYTAAALNIQFISYIDNRDFPGTTADVAIPPGPVGYQWFIHSEAINIVIGFTFVANTWSADGLLVGAVTLLYRCLVLNIPSALSLLRRLRYESPGHRYPVCHVLRLYWYVPKVSTSPL